MISNIQVCGIPMALIPHAQGSWLEGINPVTNSQWKKGVEPFMNEGAKYGLLEADGRGHLTARHFGDYKDLLDTVGSDNLPSKPHYWSGEAIWHEKEDFFIFQWRRTTSRKGLDGDGQAAVDLSWAEAKAWTLMQGGLCLLTDKQWLWSAPGGSFGLRRKIDNMWEWVERNRDEAYGSWKYVMCAGTWSDDRLRLFRLPSLRGIDYRSDCPESHIGFRVGVRT